MLLRAVMSVSIWLEIDKDVKEPIRKRNGSEEELGR
jgi:hypothetical protein